MADYGVYYDWYVKQDGKWELVNEAEARMALIAEGASLGETSKIMSGMMRYRKYFFGRTPSDFIAPYLHKVAYKETDIDRKYKYR